MIALLTSQQVFIAKGSGSVHGKALKDLVFEFNLVDDCRVCDDDGTCYFFIMTQSIDNVHKNNNWKNPMGLDKLGDYGLDLLKFANLAIS